MSKAANRNENRTYLRVFFILLSLLPVFSIVFSISLVHLLIASKSSSYLDGVNLCASIVWISGSLFGFFIIRRFKKLAPKGRRALKACSNLNQQAFTFYLSMIIPMASLGMMEEISGFACFWITMIFGIPILFRTKAYMNNPVLIGLGFNLYYVEYDNSEQGYYMLTKHSLQAGQYIYPVPIETPYFYVSKVENKTGDNNNE